MGNILGAILPVGNGQVQEPPKWLKQARKEFMTRVCYWGIPCTASFLTLLGIHDSTHGLKESAHHQNHGDPFAYTSIGFAIVSLVNLLGLTDYYLRKHTEHPLSYWRTRVALALLHMTAVASPALLFTALIVPENHVWIPLVSTAVMSIYHAIKCIRDVPPPISGPDNNDDIELPVVNPVANPVANPLANPQTVALAIANLVNHSPPPVNPGGAAIHTELALILTLALISSTNISDIIRNNFAEAAGHFEDAEELA